MKQLSNRRKWAKNVQETDTEDAWNGLFNTVFLNLSEQLLVKTSKAHLFAVSTSPSQVWTFVENLKDDALKELKKRLQIGVVGGDWEKLIAHCTSSNVFRSRQHN